MSQLGHSVLFKQVSVCVSVVMGTYAGRWRLEAGGLGLHGPMAV